MFCAQRPNTVLVALFRVYSHPPSKHMRNIAKHSAEGDKKTVNKKYAISAGKRLRLLQRDFLSASITSAGSIAFRSCFLCAKHTFARRRVGDCSRSIYGSLKCDMFLLIATWRIGREMKGERDGAQSTVWQLVFRGCGTNQTSQEMAKQTVFGDNIVCSHVSSACLCERCEIKIEMVRR